MPLVEVVSGKGRAWGALGFSHGSSVCVGEGAWAEVRARVVSSPQAFPISAPLQPPGSPRRAWGTECPGLTEGRWPACGG